MTRASASQSEAYGPVPAEKLDKSPENGSRNTMFVSCDRFLRFKKEPTRTKHNLMPNTGGIFLLPNPVISLRFPVETDNFPVVS
jgi:hypothetical protein